MKEETFTLVKKLNRKIRRPIGLIMVLLVVVFGMPKFHLFVIVSPLLAIGLIVRIWAAGVLHKNKTVTSTGPYSYVRNPLYLGSFLLGLGFCFLTHKLWIVIFGLGLFALIYGFTIYSEERELENRFGDAYREYKKKVPSFIPRFRFSPKTTFDWATFSIKQAFIINKEYNAILGTFGLFILMYIKYRYGWGY